MSALLAAISAGVALGLGVGELLLHRTSRAHRPVHVGPDGGPADGHVPAWLLRAAVRVGTGVGARLPVGVDAERRLEAAGLAPRVTPADLAALRGAGLVCGLAACVVLLPLAGGGAVLFGLVVAGATALAPQALVARRTRRRAVLMLDALPDAIDLLRVALRGGRSVTEALAAVGAHHPGTLGAELRRAAAEVRMGEGVEAALVRFRRRCPAEGADEMVALLLRTHRHGGPAVDGLRSLAEDLRARRARRAIDAANRAAPKVQLVVALLLVPAAMLLIAAVLLRMRA